MHSHPFQKETGDTIVHWMHGTTVYEFVGDLPVWIMTLLAIAAAFVDKKRIFRASPPS